MTQNQKQENKKAPIPYKKYEPPYKGLDIPSREEFHRTFGGYIYKDDFDGIYPVADRIVSDQRFDKRCEDNIKHRKRKRNKSTTI